MLNKLKKCLQNRLKAFSLNGTKKLTVKEAKKKKGRTRGTKFRVERGVGENDGGTGK